MIIDFPLFSNSKRSLGLLQKRFLKLQDIQIATVMAIAFLGILTPPTLAQDAAAEVPGVEDEAEPLRINVTGELLEQPVFTPFRREGTVRETSQPVYVINRQQIEAQGARTVDEALRYLPGVLSEGTAGGQLGTLSGQFIRGGVSAQTLILLDGRPLNEGATGGVDLSDFTTDAVEQIEVLPGGGSVLYGSNAIGGVINIITRKPPEGGVEVTAGITGGSFGFNDQVLQVRGATDAVNWVAGYNRTSADNDFPFSLTSTDFDSTRANAEVLYNNVNLSIAGNINDRNEVRFGLLYLNKDLAVPGGFPVPDSISGGFNALTLDDRQETENWLLDLTYESQLSQSQDSVLTARVYADFLDRTFADPVADNDFESPSEFRTDQMALGGQLQHAWQFASNQNITYGLDYRYVEADNSTLDLTEGNRTLNYSDSINQWGLFSRYQIDIIPRLSANFGVRQDFNDLADGSFTSYNVGMQANLTDTTTFRTNFARNFRVPSLGDLFFEPFNNPDLDPESALSFDVGVDQELGDRGLVRFTFYRNDIKDAISFDLETSTPQNIGRVRAHGIETEASYQLFDDIFAFGNYTWNRPIIKDGPTPDNNGNLLPFTHADSWNVGLSYENQQGLYAALFLHTVRDFFVDRGNAESLDGRTTLDFKLRVPVSDVVAVNASVNNIFDTQYEEFPGFPGLGRNFQIGLRSTF